jgi:hypothetical protein
MSSIEKTLEERGARYGSFEEHSSIAQAVQAAYRTYPEKWEKLPPVLKQGLTTIADKIARMLNGDHMYDDNIHDIIGYAKLMEDWVKKENTKEALRDFGKAGMPIEFGKSGMPPVPSIPIGTYPLGGVVPCKTSAAVPYDPNIQSFNIGYNELSDNIHDSVEEMIG